MKIIGLVRNLADHAAKSKIFDFAQTRPLLKRGGDIIFDSVDLSAKENWEETRLGEIVDELVKSDHLLIEDLSILGKSILVWLEVLSVIIIKHINFYVIDSKIIIEQHLPASDLSLSLIKLVEKEQELRSIRTKLGRPAGKISKNKLDPFREEIEKMLSSGVTQRFIARKYGVTPATFSYWKKTREIK